MCVVDFTSFIKVIFYTLVRVTGELRGDCVGIIVVVVYQGCLTLDDEDDVDDDTTKNFRLNLRELSMNREEWIGKIDEDVEHLLWCWQMVRRRGTFSSVIITSVDHGCRAFERSVHDVGIHVILNCHSSGEITLSSSIESVCICIFRCRNDTDLWLQKSRPYTSCLNRKLRIKSHFPTFQEHVKFPSMRCKYVSSDSRFSILERVDANQRFRWTWRVVIWYRRGYPNITSSCSGDQTFFYSRAESF